MGRCTDGYFWHRTALTVNFVNGPGPGASLLTRCQPGARLRERPRCSPPGSVSMLAWCQLFGVVAAVTGAACCVVFVGYVHESNIKHIDDMLVVERVKNIFALSAAFY